MMKKIPLDHERTLFTCARWAVRVVFFGGLMIACFLLSQAALPKQGHELSIKNTNCIESGTPEVNATQTWDRTWSGLRDDQGNGVAVDGSGNIFVTGETSSFGNGASKQQYNAFLAKYSSSGISTWNRTWGGTKFDAGEGVAVDAGGNAYIVGLTRSFGKAGSIDAFIAKYNATGTQQWNKTWGSTNTDQGWGIAVDGSGNAYITGYTYTGPVRGGDAFIAKYSTLGTSIWNRTWGGANEDDGYGIAVNGSGNVVYITGFTCSFGDPSGDAFIAKYWSNGTSIWNRTWGYSMDDVGKGVIIDGNGNAIMTGYTDVGNNDAFIAKYSSGGTQLWNRTWGGYYDQQGLSVAVDGRNNICLAGHTQDNGSLFYALIVKYSPAGTQLWNRTWVRTPSFIGSYGTGVAIDSSGNMFLDGYTYTNAKLNNSVILVKYVSDYLPGTPILNAIAPSTTHTISLSWTPGAGATLYQVYRYNHTITVYNGSLTLVGSTSSMSTTDTVHGSGSGTWYYVVTAVNATGESGISNCQAGVISIPPGVPTLNTINPSTNGTLCMSWTSSFGASSYSLYRYTHPITMLNGSVISVSNLTSTSCQDNGLANGTYYYVVTARNATGVSGISNCQSGSVAIPPARVSITSIVFTTGNGTYVGGMTFVVRVSFSNTGDTPATSVSALLTYGGYLHITSNASALITVGNRSTSVIDFLASVDASAVSLNPVSISATWTGTEQYTGRALNGVSSAPLNVNIKAQAVLAINGAPSYRTGGGTYVAGMTFVVRVTLNNPATSAKAITVTALLNYNGATGLSDNGSASKTISGAGFIDFMVSIATGASTQAVSITATTTGIEEITDRVLNAGPSAALNVNAKAQATLMITNPLVLQTGNGTYIAGTTFVVRVNLNNPATSAMAIVVNASLNYGVATGVSNNVSASKIISGNGFIDFMVNIAANTSTQAVSITATSAGLEEISLRGIVAGPSAALNVNIKAQANLTISGVTFTTGNGTYIANQQFTVRVSLNNPVTSAKAMDVTAMLSGLVAGVTANSSASKTISGAGYIDFLIAITLGVPTQVMVITATASGSEEITARSLTAGPSSALTVNIKAQAMLTITGITFTTGNGTYTAGTTFVVRVALNNPATSAKAFMVTAMLNGFVAGVTANSSTSKTISGAGFIDFLITVTAGTASQALAITATASGSEEITFRALNSDPSATLNVNITASLSSPSAPQLFSARPGNRQVMLNWTAPASDGGSAITNYRIYLGTTSNGETLLTTIGALPTYTVTGLTNGITYYFIIAAVNNIGDGSNSTEASATPATTLVAPFLLSITPKQSTNGTLFLAWTASNGATFYKLYRYSRTITTLNTSVFLVGTFLSITGRDSGLPNGTWYYVVTAVNASEESPISNCISGIVAIPPNPPVTPSFFVQYGLFIILACVAMITIAAVAVVASRRRKVKRSKPIKRDETKSVFAPQVPDKIPEKAFGGNAKGASTDRPQPMTAEAMAELQKTEQEVTAQLDVKMCIVHKGPIKGVSYSCPQCSTFYCYTCASTLAKNGEGCWSCGHKFELDQTSFTGSDEKQPMENDAPGNNQ